MATVNNQDIAGLNDRMNRFIIESCKCQSAKTSQVSAADIIRLKSYLSACKTYHGWVIGEPELDLPETHARPITLKPNPETPEVENENINDIVRQMAVVRDELVLSQSAMKASGMIPFDSARFLAGITKMEQFITEYVEKATPLDLPESSPES